MLKYMLLFNPMIEEYFELQMNKASYELIDNGKRYYAEIKSLPGVWATGKNLEDCRRSLFSSLEGWFILSLQKNIPIPHFKLPKRKMTKRQYA